MNDKKQGDNDGTDLRAHLDQRPMTTFQWSVIAVCMALNMIDGFDVLVMAFTASAVSAHWKLSGSEGFLLSAGSSAWPPVRCWRRLADKLGRRPLILLCLAVSGLGMLASAWSQTPTQLAVLRVITGLRAAFWLQQCDCQRICPLRWRSLAVTPIDRLQRWARPSAAASRSGCWRTMAGVPSSCLAACSTLAVLVLAWFALPESMDSLLVKRPANALQRLNALIRKMGLPALGSCSGRGGRQR
jgi:MFS family permease